MALLMTAIVEIAKASAEYTPKVIELTDKEKALLESIDAVRDATKESAEAFSSNVESISTNKTQAAGLLEKLKELAPEAKNDASKMQEMQDQLANVEVEGISGGGLVAVRMTAKMDVKGIKIDPSLMKAEEREVLEDLLVTALSDARRKAETAMQEKMQALTGGLGLPPGLFGQ